MENKKQKLTDKEIELAYQDVKFWLLILKARAIKALRNGEKDV